MVFAIPLADDHPDNALKDGYLSRSEQVRCHDSTTGIDGIFLNLRATTRDAKKSRDKSDVIQLKNCKLILLFYRCNLKEKIN